MIDIAKAAASCACAGCKAFDARPGFTLGVVHSASDFYPQRSARCETCGEPVSAGTTCGSLACRTHEAA